MRKRSTRMTYRMTTSESRAFATGSSRSAIRVARTPPSPRADARMRAPIPHRPAASLHCAEPKRWRSLGVGRAPHSMPAASRGASAPPAGAWSARMGDPRRRRHSRAGLHGGGRRQAARGQLLAVRCCSSGALTSCCSLGAPNQSSPKPL